MLQRERGRPIGSVRSGCASRQGWTSRAAFAGALGRGLAALAAGMVLVGGLGGCATKGDLLALEERVADAEQQGSNGPDPFARIADLSAEIDLLRDEMSKLRGQVEVAEKKAEDALADARRARSGAAAGAGAGAAVAVTGGEAVLDAAAVPPEDDDPAASAEIVAYREALNAWRENDNDLCIDRFRKFLQGYPSSPYADDGAYWMADCHFKKGEYRQAVLRFNDVVRVYPSGNKAPDALYRQGESLLKLGPGFYDAAKTVFQQVLNDYPDSDRAKEARQQLEAIGTS